MPEPLHRTIEKSDPNSTRTVVVELFCAVLYSLIKKQLQMQIEN
jgi:hypothetical protein